MKRLLLFLITALPILAAGDTPFTVNLPQGWTVQKLQQGYVRMESPDKSRFVLVRPILGRTADCQESLRRAFSASWSAYAGPVSAVGVAPRRRVPRPRSEMR